MKLNSILIEKVLPIKKGIHAVGKEEPLRGLWGRLKNECSLPEALELIRKQYTKHGSMDPFDMVFDLWNAGLISIQIKGEGEEAAALRQVMAREDAWATADAGSWNLYASEREWRLFYSYFDFLDPQSPIHAIKRIQTACYMDILTPSFRKMNKSSSILDAGCGIGRFTLPLSKKGFKVTGVDISLRALLTLLRHSLREGTHGNITLLNLSAHDLTPLESNSFDLVLASELINYTQHPEQILAELFRVAKPGAIAVIVCEGLYGALLSDNKIGLADAPEILSSRTLTMPHYAYTKYFTKEELKTLVSKSGFVRSSIKGCLYTVEGILGHLVSTKERINLKQIRTVEKACRNDPSLEPLARTWICITEKPV